MGGGQLRVAVVFQAHDAGGEVADRERADQCAGRYQARQWPVPGDQVAALAGGAFELAGGGEVGDDGVRQVPCGGTQCRPVDFCGHRVLQARKLLRLAAVLVGAQEQDAGDRQAVGGHAPAGSVEAGDVAGVGLEP
ncbi:MAG: hypothetical protein BGO37_12785 [Cellulomonas sp. 73-92]|nr:MAG: hypothetical protein BGO37_12785 [Cellulomonas sp. 73-92]